MLFSKMTTKYYCFPWGGLIKHSLFFMLFSHYQKKNLFQISWKEIFEKKTFFSFYQIQRTSQRIMHSVQHCKPFFALFIFSV